MDVLFSELSVVMLCFFINWNCDDLCRVEDRGFGTSYYYYWRELVTINIFVFFLSFTITLLFLPGLGVFVCLINLHLQLTFSCQLYFVGLARLFNDLSLYFLSDLQRFFSMAFSCRISLNFPQHNLSTVFWVFLGVLYAA